MLCTNRPTRYFKRNNFVCYPDNTILRYLKWLKFSTRAEKKAVGLFINPLPSDWPAIFSSAKIFILNKEGISERISYERRAYDRVGRR